MIRIVLYCICLTLSIPSLAQTIEAEKGMLSGTTISTQISGYSGTGYVTGFDAAGDEVGMALTANRGIYDLYVRYASPSGDKFNFVWVNGQNLGSVSFPRSSSFREIIVGKIYLQAGPNTIAISKDWGYFDVDNIRLEPSQRSEIYNIAGAVVTPLPSFRADSLYDFLSAIYGKVILSGQYGGAAELDRIRNVSGKTPVVRGFDMMDYSPSRVERGTTSMDVEEAIAWSGERGIVTFCWHWNAPKDLIDEPGREWWRGFYTEATTFDITKAMADPQSEEYTLIIRDIDAIAVQLKRLQDADVPVIWRPLHEAEGTWFWWGARGAEPCRWLWRLMFDRLVNHHQINNLIWTWTSSDKPSALDWYPGDEFVDMIGADIYLPAGMYSSSFITFDNLAALYDGKKIIALSENGPMPHAERMFVEGAAWSWFSTWSGSFITDGISNTAEHIDATFNHDYVITLDEIGNVNAIIEALALRKEEIEKDSIVVSIADHHPPVIIYRNPIINEQLTVTLKNMPSQAAIVIMDAQGRVQLSAESDNSAEQHFHFDFNGRADGVYLLKITTPHFTKLIRFLKN